MNETTTDPKNFQKIPAKSRKRGKLLRSEQAELTCCCGKKCGGESAYRRHVKKCPTVKRQAA